MSFVFSRHLFLRLLGGIYLIGFVSLGVQITGLIGAHGILPVAPYLTDLKAFFGADAYRLVPTLLWFRSTDAALLFLCWGGAAASLALIAGVQPVITCAVLWMFYLSLTAAGQVFLQFQWDALLLETGLLAILYAPLCAPPSEPNWIVRVVLWSLVFKLTFLSGITKLLSGDPAWAGWTAMTYHYWTQPLPTWTSWYAQQLPAMVHYWSVPLMLTIELVAPFTIVLPSRFRAARLVGCLLMILLQAIIGLTGNYGFFNLLSIVLYLTLLDDGHFRRGAAFSTRATAPDAPTPREPRAWQVAVSTAAVAIACLSAIAFIREIQATAGTSVQIARAWPGRILEWVSPLESVNGYGLFRVMTTSRPELVIEVSEDGEHFVEYPFRWKPGDVNRRPQFIEPHMPRLDWQMWFAALDPRSAEQWLVPLTRRIADGEPTVARLLGPDPLRSRPVAVRIAHYSYRLTTPAERAHTGAWWVRTLNGYLN